MNLNPSTPEEEEALHRMFENAEVYRVKVDLIVLALDKETLARRGVELMESAQFDDPDAQRYHVENTREDLSSALGAVLKPFALVAPEDGVLPRSVSFHVERLDREPGPDDEPPPPPDTSA